VRVARISAYYTTVMNGQLSRIEDLSTLTVFDGAYFKENDGFL